MDSLRLSDAEREEAVARLGEHYAAGRLDKDEYDERSDVVWSAKTRGELRPVFADLEAPTQSRSPYAASRPARPSLGSISRRRRGWRMPAPLVVALVVLVALTVVTHLPIILIGLVVWCALRFHPGYHRRRW